MSYRSKLGTVAVVLSIAALPFQYAFASQAGSDTPYDIAGTDFLQATLPNAASEITGVYAGSCYNSLAQTTATGDWLVVSASDPNAVRMALVVTNDNQDHSVAYYRNVDNLIGGAAALNDILSQYTLSVEDGSLVLDSPANPDFSDQIETLQKFRAFRGSLISQLSPKDPRNLQGTGITYCYWFKLLKQL